MNSHCFLGNYLCGMRRWIGILLLVVMGHQLVLKLGLRVWYEANKDYITQNFCENLDRPELNCCGKCFLKKQLKTVEKHNSYVGDTNLKVEQVDNFICVLPALCSLVVSGGMMMEEAPRTPIVSNRYSRLVPVNIFHPPALFV